MQNSSFSDRTWASLHHQTAFDQKLDESSASHFHLYSLNEWFEAHCTKPKICFRTAFMERYDFYNILGYCDNLIIGLCEMWISIHMKIEGRGRSYPLYRSPSLDLCKVVDEGLPSRSKR